MIIELKKDGIKTITKQKENESQKTEYFDI